MSNPALPVSPTADAVAPDTFAWPLPPQGHFRVPNTSTVRCEISNLAGRHGEGVMNLFSPSAQLVHIHLLRTRAPVPLRFDQFRSLLLLDPLRPLDDTPVEWADYRIVWKGDGGELGGRSAGHVQTPFGVFLFPGDEEGRVRRLFVPHAAYERIETDAAAAGGTLSQVATRRSELLQALQRQASAPIVRIGEALISLGMINEEQLNEALAAQRQMDNGLPLGELLVRMGAVSAADLKVALTRKMGYPVVDLQAFESEPDALTRLSHAVARRLQLLPLIVADGRLVVAMDDPANRHGALDEAEFIAQMKIAPVLGQCEDFEACVFAAYDKIGAASEAKPTPSQAQAMEFETTDTSSLLESLEKENQTGLESDDDRPIEQSDNSLVRMINRMILEAFTGGVSDIHVESYPGKEKIRIRFRKDGLLRTYLELPHNYRNAVIARIKIMADLDISERRKPQDGKINFARFSPKHRLELRVATIPTNNGLEDVVMRILASAKPLPLDKLGLTDSNYQRLRAAIERPYGMVLCVGPTGSGKTTTLHSALSHINTPERKIWTAEDPIEITQTGLRQVQVNARIDWTFARALRAFLRADPDVIMVGEIRDEETARVSIEASLTGHLVLSTLHTNSAPETVTRLLDMGMDPFNFADSLLAVLAQRLVRRLCPSCRTSRPASPAEIDELVHDYLHAYGAAQDVEDREALLARWRTRYGVEGQLQFHHSPGCPVCEKTGFKGRVGLHELMVISRELRELIQGGARVEALLATAVRQDMRTLRQDGIEKVLSGQTTIEEVRATSNS
ncbi:MAG: Flp pilus assembly complex ATPase component TadA [Pseudacidovorax sp.]|nr:Flp pilus assembly complex ATPase component TadA [Pseudacidovorax sp.]